MRKEYNQWLKTTGPRFLELYKDKPLQDTVELYLDCLVDAKTSNTRESRLTNLFYAKALKDEYSFGRIPKEAVGQAIKGRETMRRVGQKINQECAELEIYSENSPSYQNGSYSRAIESRRRVRDNLLEEEMTDKRNLCKELSLQWAKGKGKSV